MAISNVVTKRQSRRRPRPNNGPRLSPKFKRAVLYAASIHGGKLRKKTRIPDIGHILGVTAIALEYGADETEAIAALLHDAVEDAGGKKRLLDIRRKFGPEVAKIVEGCTDSLEESKPRWLERKKQYVRHVRNASVATKLVSAADKLQNVRSLLRNYREEGDRLWKRYTSGKAGALWYYRELVRAFTGKRIEPLVKELDRAVSELEWLANRGRKTLKPPAFSRGR
ncbi:MAG TPA: HD domain-containing protein [Chthoniobacterales bacterium]|nr:HD domain-containing protein [Chthoniobacterales bacterium]